MKGVKTMKRTHNNDIEELLNSNYDFDCYKGNKEWMNLCDFSSDIYECAKESYQNDNYSDEYSFFEFSARLYG